MNYQFWVVVAIMVAAAVLGYFFWYRPKKKQDREDAQQGCPDTHAPSGAQGVCLPRQFAYQIDRPDGGTVVVELGTKPDEATLSMINARIISGLSRMIAATRRDYPGWGNMLSTAAYTVIFVRKMATNMDGTPALIVSGIQSAGTIANAKIDGSARGLQYIILPQPDDWNMPGYADYLEASTYSEGEHVIEYNNDFAVFMGYARAGDVHPHREPISPVGLLRGMDYDSVVAVCAGVKPVDSPTTRLNGRRLG